MYNYRELQEKVAVLVQRSNDSDYKNKIGVWLNLSQSFLADSYDYYTSLQETYDFNTADGTEEYPMPNNFNIPLRIVDLDNNNVLNIITEEEYIDSFISNIDNTDAEGVPNVARISGVSGTLTQISSSGDTVKVKSSSSSDGGEVIRIRGYLDSNHLIEGFEDITISATNPTTYASGTTTFYKILHVSKSEDTTGYITIANSSDVVLDYLGPVDRVARHKIVKLGDSVPDDTYSMRVLYKRIVPKMVNNNDYPFIECDNFLILDAWAWALSQDKETMPHAVQVWAKAKEALMEILSKENNSLGPDFEHKIISRWTKSHRR